MFEKICLIFTQFVARDSAEASAEASVDLAEASVSAESRFTPIRSFTSKNVTFTKFVSKKCDSFP